MYVNLKQKLIEEDDEETVQFRDEGDTNKNNEKYKMTTENDNNSSIENPLLGKQVSSSINEHSEEFSNGSKILIFIFQTK